MAKKSNFKIFQKLLHPTHLRKLLDKMYKYEMDQTRRVGLQSGHGMRDGWTDVS